jgi:hypothetical protein
MRDEARHNMMLYVMDLALGDAARPVALWTLGGPGVCALRAGAHNLVLADLDREQCAALAAQTIGLDLPGVLGPDLTAQWYATAARQHGFDFAEPIPQRIHSLDREPAYPGSPGSMRQLEAGDMAFFHGWLCAFVAEALPDDPQPDEEEAHCWVSLGRCFCWELHGEPVSMAALVRRTQNAGTISLVYTPPHLRGRGFAGSVTAALVEHIFSQGKRLACLYTVRRNPSSNRCYEKIGFRPVCDSLLYPRRAKMTVGAATPPTRP